MSPISLETILEGLQAHRTRATYGAVGEVLSIPAIAVGARLGLRRPLASWVVNAETGDPSGYSHEECHADLYTNPKIMRTGKELRALLGIKLKTVRMIGLDMAWKTEKNPSGIAIGALRGNTISLEKLRTGVVGLQELQSEISNTKSLTGIAIDAPLIITNSTGKRDCERDLTARYSARWAGCHAANLKMLPNADSVRLASWLSTEGFTHLGIPGTQKWQIECYPHPAIIEIFGLKRRHLYKKGTLAERRAGQAGLAKMIASLHRSEGLSLKLCCSSATDAINKGKIDHLSGQALKDNEDGLDAIICLYIAGLYAIGHRQQVFGNSDSGYIVVPDPL